jgi:hypothetical protein
LATAFLKVLGNDKASKQIFNISGDKYVTFDGLAKACAKVSNASCYIIFTVISIYNCRKFLDLCLVFYFAIFQAGGFPEPEIVHYNPKDFDFGKKKSFPFRDQVKYQQY